MSVDQSGCRAAAELLCTAAETVLWPDIAHWSPRSAHGHRLECRVGSGEATYYRAQGLGSHRLTFGWKMVASKRDPLLARQWLTGREMLARGYFAGQFTLPTLLAHTCCHEFAHLVQALNGWMSRGSVHNRQFYRILDEIYAADAAERVLGLIERDARQLGLPLEFADSEGHAPGEAKRFRMGQRVRFDYRGAPVVGEVIRVNRKTVNVKPLAARYRNEYFRISPHYLTPCAEPA